MNHPDMEAQVDALLDGELAPADAIAVEGHLHGCSSCSGFRAERLALRSAIAASTPRQAASPALRARVAAIAARRFAARRFAAKPAAPRHAAP